VGTRRPFVTISWVTIAEAKNESGDESPHSKDAVYFDFAFEVLQSSNLALVAAVLPLCSDLF